ncbi:catalase [filamentous cyanobacterium CCP5]|nr:catalase [filamentous cyanobacterium CCP5]
MELFTEYPETNEPELYQRVAEQVQLNLEKLYGDRDRVLRDTHAKSHACVQGSLEIFDFDEGEIKQTLKQHSSLSPERADAISFKQGLFAQPRRYPVWIRFANGRAEVDNDYVPDARSMSVKIMGVEGERLPASHESHTQDVITQNAEIFFIKSIRDYFGFFRSVVRGNLWPLLWLLSHPRQLLPQKAVTRRCPKSLLTQRCWSGSASALGLPENFDQAQPGIQPVSYPAAIKYGFTPVSCTPPHAPLPATSRSRSDRKQAKLKSRLGTPDHYYRHELIQALAEPDAQYCWDFQIQVQTRPQQSIDDVTIPWDESAAPFVTVGRLTVSHQVIDFENQCEFCENLRFSPWNGLAVHRPIGALNRLRSGIYRQVGEYRLGQRGVEYQEPTGADNLG